ncbi:MFS transporter [Paenibacillus xerothermodurans]|uniref:MFS transporter n=1 Tax=Paenibacillus xerothermodurans TaxID=1977292 RepID=A0A2W1NP30_PAEXE|nr:MFS transporter [Paenibacillus xerothermodurans]PZE21235.1 MFS transporter [Paenibacillus xerothermodurans]
MQNLWSKNFLSVCLSNFFIFMTFYILAVTLPAFVLDDLHGSQQQIGLVTTVFVIAGVIFRPLTGKWLDELNRRKITLASMILFTLCSFLYLAVDDFTQLLILRVIHGVSFGIAATATSAIVIDIIPEERKGEGIGYFTLFMSIAMVIGPFLGLTLISRSSFTYLFAACAVFSLLSFLTGLLTRIPERTAVAVRESSWSWRRFIEPKAVPIAVAGFVLAFSYGAISTFISVYAKSLGMESAASYFFVVFAAVILLSRPFTGRLFDRMGEHVLVYPGITLFVAGMIWLSQAESAAVLLLSGAVIGLGFGALLPSFQAIAIKASPVHRRGLATGTYFVFFDTGYGVGSYLLGMLAAYTDYHFMYLIGGVIVATTAVIYYGLHHRAQRVKQAVEV